uniref:Uncharacterized protein n=1 Tax=uncultured Thiotrichaceae bacterium TaxID=298394 RepID=A0A6S6U5X0_9GAMM|nr:MAG: Unknown protein [uncultured Thiotrichaceae bacterium]
MMNNKKLPTLLSTCTGVSLMMGSSLLMASVLEYKLSLSEDGEAYEIWMRPSETPSPDINLTGQVTIRTPADANFKAVNVVSTMGNGKDWLEASRVDSPEESDGYDYISFSFLGMQGGAARNYQWKKDEEKLVLTFSNEAGCVNDVSIMGDDDPFNITDNSAGTNPGNQFTNLGWGVVGANNFKSVYGEGFKCSE